MISRLLSSSDDNGTLNTLPLPFGAYSLVSREDLSNPSYELWYVIIMRLQHKAGSVHYFAIYAEKLCTKPKKYTSYKQRIASPEMNYESMSCSMVASTII